MKADPTRFKARVARVRRLVALADALRHGESFNITKLTVLKSLCEDPHDADAFLLYLARQAQGRMKHSKRPDGLSPEAWERHRTLADEAIAWLEKPLRGEEPPHLASDLYHRLRREQDEHRSIPFGVLRLLNDRDLAVIEHALSARFDPRRAPQQAYATARLLAEEYNPGYGTGLIPASVAAVQVIADFWVERLGLSKAER